MGWAKIAGTEVLFERYFEGYVTGYDPRLGEVYVAEHPQDPGRTFALGNKVFLLGARSPEGLRNLRVPLEKGQLASLDMNLNNDPGEHADSLEAGDLCTVALSERGLAVFVTAFRENLGKLFVTAVHPGPQAGSVTVTVSRNGVFSTYVIEKTATVTLNGQLAAPGDLVEDDVVYLASYGAESARPVIAARVVRSVVEGEARDSRTVYTGAGHVHYCTLQLAGEVAKG